MNHRHNTMFRSTLILVTLQIASACNPGVGKLSMNECHPYVPEHPMNPTNMNDLSGNILKVYHSTLKRWVGIAL